MVQPALLVWVRGACMTCIFCFLMLLVQCVHQYSFLVQSSGCHWALSIPEFISPVFLVLVVLKGSPGSLLISFIPWLNKLFLDDIFVTKVIFTFFRWACFIAVHLIEENSAELSFRSFSG